MLLTETITYNSIISGCEKGQPIAYSMIATARPKGMSPQMVTLLWQETQLPDRGPTRGPARKAVRGPARGPVRGPAQDPFPRVLKPSEVIRTSRTVRLRSLMPNVIVYSAVINSCKKGRVIIYNLITSTCEKGQSVQIAVHLSQEMLLQHLLPHV